MAMNMRERVDSLENALKELAYAGRHTEMTVDRLAEELKEFKGEMAAFKGEMADFKDEMLAFKEESRRATRRMNQQWGSLANKMGTFVEDMVFPNFPHILARYFGIGEDEVDEIMVNRLKRHPTVRSRRKEFDLIAWTADIVFWNETKVSPKMRYLVELVEDTESIFEFFPELVGKRLVKIVSSLAMTTEEVDYLTKNRCYAMALGDETMDLVNFEQIGGAA